LRITRSTSGTSSMNSSPATSQALWALGYSHGPSNGEAGIGRDPSQVHAALF
jgi:hypothetical protein